MTLIHSALLCECWPVIEQYNLELVVRKKEYKNDVLVVVVSGIGIFNTKQTLHHVFEKYEIKRAINIGIAGCRDKKVPIGTLFCTNKKLSHIPNTTLCTVDEPTKNIETTLCDMEASAFEKICVQQGVDFYTLKVVSDYLDDIILPKAQVTKLIKDSLKQWKQLI